MSSASLEDNQLVRSNTVIQLIQVYSTLLSSQWKLAKRDKLGKLRQCTTNSLKRWRVSDEQILIVSHFTVPTSQPQRSVQLVSTAQDKKLINFSWFIRSVKFTKKTTLHKSCTLHFVQCVVNLLSLCACVSMCLIAMKKVKESTFSLLMVNKPPLTSILSTKMLAL